MKDIVYIDSAKPQWKGNFHTHTTQSDGKESVEYVIDLYKNAGYDFLAISDHELYFDTDEYDSEDFKLLAGIECAIAKNPDDKWFVGKNFFSVHLHGIFDYSAKHDGPKYTHMQRFTRSMDFGIDSWQKQIDTMKEHNLMVFLNHPNWSRMKPEHMVSLHSYIATEVLNYGCEVLEGTGPSEYEWDYCLRNGKRVFCVATDDGHHYTPEKMQALGGFTMVESDSLDKAQLCASIKAGKMYASSGPSIYDMRVEDGVLKMKFSPAKAVNLIGYDRFAPQQRAADGTLIEGIEWKIDERLKVVRPEVVGPDGRKAWGQAIFLNDIFGE